MRGFANVKPPPALNALMVVGDSIAHGDPAGLGGFRASLLALAPTIAFTGRVDWYGLSESYAGFAIDQVLAAMGDVVFRYAPRTILMMLGLNDVALQSQTSGATLTEMRAAAESLLAQSSNVANVLVADSPLPTSGTGWYATMDAVNTGRAAAFAGCDARIKLITICDTLVRPDDFGDSSAHPNLSGYAKIGARALAELGRLGLSPP